MRQPKPQLSFWQIWNMCFGFLGLQFAFGLQNANVSRIFQSLGANLEQIPVMWIAAPLTGLLVQPDVDSARPAQAILHHRRSAGGGGAVADAARTDSLVRSRAALGPGRI